MIFHGRRRCGKWASVSKSTRIFPDISKAKLHAWTGLTEVTTDHSDCNDPPNAGASLMTSKTTNYFLVICICGSIKRSARLTLILTLSLTLTISITRSQLVRATNYGWWWLQSNRAWTTSLLANNIIGLSVCLWRCALWLNDASYNKRE